MLRHVTTLLGSMVVGVLLGALLAAVGVPFLGAAVIGVLFALVSGLIASRYEEDWPRTVEASVKAVGVAAAFVGVNLIADCTLATILPRDSLTILEECSRHWPFWVTALCFVPILGASMIHLVRTVIQERLRHEG